MIWISIRLKCGNQSCYPWCEDNQISATHPRAVGVRHACWYKYRGSRANGFGSVAVSECEFAIEYMPGFVVGMMNVQRCWATAPPFMDAERFAGSSKRFRLHRQILTPFGSQQCNGVYR